MTNNWQYRLLEFPEYTHLATGDANAFDIKINEILLKNGRSISLQDSGVTAIVGANNTGKSTLLTEVFSKLHSPHPSGQSPVSVDSVKLKKAGTAGDLVAWLANKSHFSIHESQPYFSQGMTSPIAISTLEKVWNNDTSLGVVAPLLSRHQLAGYVNTMPTSVEARLSMDEPPTDPLHHLQDSHELFEEISQLSRDVFGTRLTLDPLGRQLHLRVGEVKTEPPPVNAITREYREEMFNLQKFDKQGDGIRSFIGQLLPLVSGSFRIIIMDEPEAFLHPPQAYALGVQLGRLATQANIQILLSTHDKSLLTGLLDSEVSISVTRLEGQHTIPTTKSLEPEQLRTLWSDPVLKYTNVLDGLFHRLVVVAEAEGDCAYLQAALDCDENSDEALPQSEIHFVPTGGIGGMVKVCKALTAVGVPVVVAPDLDILKREKDLQLLVESVGAQWTEEFSLLWGSATQAQRQQREPAKVRHVFSSIRAALENRQDEPYTKDIKDEVAALLRTRKSPWDEVKTYGVSAFKGEARNDVEKLLSKLNAVGIVPVEAGELERLAPQVTTRKGPGWLQDALQLRAHCNPATQSHLSRIIKAGQAQIDTATSS